MLNKYKISILIITYNQQDVISRAIESILVQKEYGLKEIVICDDNSTDSNWNIISEYVSKYPDIIRAYRNDPNLGIYPNCEKVVSLRGDADLYYLLSGDDILNNGWFKIIQEYITDKQININDEAISIASDWKNIGVNGNETINKNAKIVNIDNDYLSMSFRGLSCRSVMMNKKVIEKFKPIITNQGVCLAETLFDRQVFTNSDKIYYCPYIGTIYYSGIGVSIKMNSEKYIKEREHAYNKILDIYQLDKKDVFLIKSYIYYQKFLLKPSLLLFFKRLYFKIFSLKVKYGTSIKKEIIFESRMIKKLICKK